MHNGSIEQIAWSAGIRAREQGISWAKNPYLQTGPLSAFDAWNEGYNLASVLMPPANPTYQKDI